MPIDTLPQKTIDTWQFLPQAHEIETQTIHPLQKEVDTILTRLKNTSKLSRKYTITVLHSDDLGVFHAQGGRIFIPIGLLKLARDNEGARAFIIAHEIAHWENRDMIQKKVRIVLDGKRIQEAECKADITAKRLIEKAGYDAEPVQKWLQELEQYLPRYRCDI